MSDDANDGLASKRTAPTRLIRSIFVAGLQGKFDYDLTVAPRKGGRKRAEDADLAAVTADRLTLLYGVNGTGKTSLLRLLFHALSPAPDRGHRAALRQTRFSDFKVTLSDSSFVRYTRDDSEDTGYIGEVKVGRRAVVTCAFWSKTTIPPSRPDIDPQLFLSVGFEEDDPPTSSQVGRYGMHRAAARKETIEFAEALAQLGVNPVFLEDSRIITSDVLDQQRGAGRARAAVRDKRGDPDDELRKRRELDVEEALDRVRAYLSQLMFAGTQAGSMRVDNVYHKVASAIIEASPKRGRPGKTQLPKLRDRVEELDKRARPYQAYGLLPESPMKDLAKLLQQAEDKHGLVLTEVLTPHLDGFEERLDALAPGLNAVSAFVDALNSFLVGKKVRFRPGRPGVVIRDDQTNELVRPAALSSGEKQIVLLFSDIISLQNDTRLFLIDEPELSLNPDWQRNLMPSLLSLTAPSGMQLIAATHSIEIMARYRERRLLLST